MSLTFQHLPARSGRARSLVVLLHGFGANGAAMLGLGKTHLTALPDTVFLAPDAPDEVAGRPCGRMWYTIPELDGSSPEEADSRMMASARRLDIFLDDQLSASDLPASAVALLGFSQGAGMTYEVGPRRSDRLAGVVAIAGRMKRKETLASEARTAPPFLILSGAEDRLLSPNETTATIAALLHAGIPALHDIMAGTGHAISDKGIIVAQDFLKGILHYRSEVGPRRRT